MKGGRFSRGFLELVEFGVKQRVGEHVLFEECLVNGLDAADGGADEGLKGDLVDDSGQAPGQMEDGLDGAVGEELGWPLGPFEMEAQVGAGIIDGEAPELVREADALFEGFVLWGSDAGGEF